MELVPWFKDDDEPPCRECGGWHVATRCFRCHSYECVNCACEPEYDDDDDFTSSERTP